MIDVIVQNAEDTITLRFQKGGAALIICYVAIVGMGRAVNLDDETNFTAEKVSGEWAD